MKALALIEKLQELYAHYGNVEVITGFGDKGDDPFTVIDTEGYQEIVDVGGIPCGEGSIMLIIRDYPNE